MPIGVDILTAPSGRPYYVSGIEQNPISSDSKKNDWYCRIFYTDAEGGEKIVPYNKIFP